MGAVAFFPWMTVAERVTIGKVVLTPYAGPAQSTAPAPESPEASAPGDPIAKIISTFRRPGGRPIKSATIVSIEGRTDPAGDLDEDDRDLIFQHAAAIGFSGLAGRVFFEHFVYFNRDSFQCVIQLFTDANFIAVVARRLDGTQMHVTPTKDVQVWCPPHITILKGYTVDVALAEAVLEAM